MTNLRQASSSCRTLTQRLSGALLAAAGWRAEIAAPLPDRCVIIGAHHTTWWDLILTLLLMGATDVRFRWVAKESLFWWPLGALLRALGGIPVRRMAQADFVGQMVAIFARGGPLRLAILPEGTRNYANHWKTGFYYIALGADVPIILGYADFRRRLVGLGPLLVPTGDLDADFRRYHDFYAGVAALHPDRQGEVRHILDDQAGPAPREL